MDLYEKIKIILAHAGLNEHEILFYLTLLKNPYSTVHTIAKKSGLNKNKAYQTFGVLKELGIVGHAGTTQTVIPASFSNLINILNKKSRQLGRIADDLERINKMVPLLRAVKTKGDIRIYDSMDDIKEHYLDLLDLDWDNTWAYGSFEMFAKEIDPEIERKFILTRVKKGRRARGLYTVNGPFTQELVKQDSNELRTSRFLDGKQITDKWFHVFPASDLFVMWSKDKKTGAFTSLAIDNKELADFHKALFEADWKSTAVMK